MMKFAIKIVFVLVVGVVAILLAESGIEARRRTLATGTAQTEARLAIEYINYTLRTNDVTGRVEIAYAERVGRDSILIRHRTATDEFDRWIYFEDGQLIEEKVSPGEQPEGQVDLIIANLYDFEISYDARYSVIVINIDYEYSDGTRSITMSIGMRSDRRGFVIL